MTSREPRPPGTVQRLRGGRSRLRLITASAGPIEVQVVPEAEARRFPSYDGGSIELEPEDDDVIPLVMFFNHTGGKGRKTSISIQLTKLTEMELLCLRDAMNMAIAEALPLSAELDTKAKHHAQETGEPNQRFYRGVPNIRLGDGTSVIYDPDLRSKSSEPPRLVWPAGSGPRRSGVEGHAVAHRRPPGRAEAGDDPPAA